MTYTDQYGTVQPGARPALGQVTTELIVDGIIDPLEGRKENRLEHQEDAIQDGSFELRGGGTDHLNVDTSVHLRRKAS